MVSTDVLFVDVACREVSVLAHEASLQESKQEKLQTDGSMDE